MNQNDTKMINNTGAASEPRAAAGSLFWRPRSVGSRIWLKTKTERGSRDTEISIWPCPWRDPDVTGVHVFDGSKLIGIRDTEEEAKLFAEIHFQVNKQLS